MSRPKYVQLAAMPVMALTMYWVVGAVDRPWLKKYLRVSKPAAVLGCVIYRLCGGRAKLQSSIAAIRCPTQMLLIAEDLVAIWLASKLAWWIACLRRTSLGEAKASAIELILAWVWRLPVARDKIQAELDKVETDLRASLKKEIGREWVTSLPDTPIYSAKQLRTLLLKGSSVEDVKWRGGSVSGAVYHGEAEHLDLLNSAMAAYCVANPLHPDIWPSLNVMEAEIVSMTARLVDGGDRGVCGTLTSGGTESIILATKAHRDWAAKERGCSHFEIVACVTAHAAIDKACELLGIRLVKVRADPVTFRIDVDAARRAMTADTIMLYASAPSFPQGAIDDVLAVASIAHAAGIGCHVDCCLGGFVLPFLSDAPPFDFGVQGVTSMSVDTHKYGYAPKGTSVVLYRSAQLRKYQYFCYPDWTGGLYVTPTIPGSRPGSVIAATWASLVSIGFSGYKQRATDVVQTANVIAAGVLKIPHLKLLAADPQTQKVPAMIVAFASDDLNIYAVNDEMVRRGWSLNALQHPPSLHICCTVRTVGHADRFINDLKAAVDDVASNVHQYQAGSTAIYGMATSMPAGPVSEVMRLYTDIQLSIPDDTS